MRSTNALCQKYQSNKNIIFLFSILKRFHKMLASLTSSMSRRYAIVDRNLSCAISDEVKKLKAFEEVSNSKYM